VGAAGPTRNASHSRRRAIPRPTSPGSLVASSTRIELAFDALGLIPDERTAKVVEASVTWNYTTVLNIIFLARAAVLVWRFLRTGGLPMLRMMNAPAEAHGHHH
jgi:hypothetical protein